MALDYSQFEDATEVQQPKTATALDYTQFEDAEQAPQTAGTLDYSKFEDAEPTEAKPESPTWISDPVTPEEIASIATKHGLTDIEDIKALSTQIYLKGGTVEGQTRPLAYAAGLASDLLLPGDIPAFMQKKMSNQFFGIDAKPELRAAMDDVASLSEAKQSTARTVGTFVGGFAMPGLGINKVLGGVEKLAGKLAGGALFGGAMGAVGGLAESEEGQELQSAGVGAVLGSAFGGGLGAVGGWITRKEMANADRIKNVILEGSPEDEKLIPLIQKRFEETFVPGTEREYQVLADKTELKRIFGEKEIPKSLLAERKEFIKYVNATESIVPDAQAVKNVSSITRALGETRTREVYADFRKSKIAEEFKDETLTQGLDKAPVSIFQAITKVLEPAMYMANRVDKLIHSNFNKGINQLSEATNKWKNEAYKLNLKLQPLAKSALADSKKMKMSSTSYLDELFHTLDGTSTSDLFKDKPDVIKAWRDLLEDVRVVHNTANQESLQEMWLRAAEHNTNSRKWEAASAEAKALNVSTEDYLKEVWNRLEANPSNELSIKDEVLSAWKDTHTKISNVQREEIIKQWKGKDGKASFAPHRTVDVPTAIDRIQRRIFVLEDTLPQFKEGLDKVARNKKVGLEELLASLSKEDAESVNDVALAISRVTGKKITTLNELSRTFEDVSRNPAKAMHIAEVTAKSAKSRTGSTPKLLLETNMIKLTEDLIMNTVKAAYVGKILSRMKSELMDAAAAGVDKAYLDPIGDLLQDVGVGSRAGTWAQKTRDSLMAIRIQSRKAAVKAEREGKPVKAYMHSSLAKIPGIMGYMGDQVYPNTLGVLTNETSPMRNLMQPFMMTSAEVGYRYSVPTVIREMVWALLNPKKAAAELQAIGMHGEGWEKLNNSILSDPELSKATRAAMKVNAEAMEWNMKLFSWSEVVNRYVAYKLGKKAAADMVSSVSNPGRLTFDQSTALNFIETLPDANKRSVMALLESLPNSDAPEGVISQLEKEVAQHLIQKTIFDYNKANASIIARYLPAPVLVFTKFPTYLAGDILNKIEDKGLAAAAAPLMRSYLAPFAIAGQLDELNDEMMGDDETLMDWAFGKSGLKGVTNFGALGGFRALGNPIAAAPIKIAGKVGEAAVGVMQGDLEAAGKALVGDKEGELGGAAKELANTAALYSPTIGSGLVRGFNNWSKLFDQMLD